MGYFPRKSVADQNILSKTWHLKCKRETYWTIRKSNVQYYVRVGLQRRPSPEPLNSYSPVVQLAIVRLMLIFQCIQGLHS